MPLTIARTLDADFSAPIRAILDTVEYDSAYKIAWEAPRFWEKEANIFGGISYLQQTVDLVWYPSARFFSPTGVVIGGYSIELRRPRLAARSAGEDRTLRTHSYGEWIRLRPSAFDAGQARRLTPLD